MTSQSRVILRRSLSAVSLSGTVLGMVLTSAGAPAATKKKTTTKTTVKRIGTGVTVAGPAIETGRWGPVEVDVKIAARKIIAVSTPLSPNHTGRSIEINKRALPLYKAEALTAQSAYIDIVSGATDTWSAYALSLRGAIDAAKAKALL